VRANRAVLTQRAAGITAQMRKTYALRRLGERAANPIDFLNSHLFNTLGKWHRRCPSRDHGRARHSHTPHRLLRSGATQFGSAGARRPSGDLSELLRFRRVSVRTAGAADQLSRLWSFAFHSAAARKSAAQSFLTDAFQLHFIPTLKTLVSRTGDFFRYESVFFQFSHKKAHFVVVSARVGLAGGLLR